MKLTVSYSRVRLASEDPNLWVIRCQWRRNWTSISPQIPEYRCKINADEMELIRETVGLQADRMTGGTLNNPHDILKIGHLNRIILEVRGWSDGGYLRFQQFDKKYNPPEIINLQDAVSHDRGGQDWRPESTIPEDFYS